MDRHTAEGLLGPRWPRMDVASTTSLREAGISDRLLTEGVKSGAIIRLRRGAYIPAHRWSALKPWEQDAARIDGHIAGTGGSSVYCLASAAILHGCSVWNAGSAVHVATGYSGARSSRGTDTLSHELGLSDTDVAKVERNGRLITVTTVVRTLVDCFRFLPHEQALVIGDSALHHGLASAKVIRDAMMEAPDRGRRRALAVLHALEGRTESPGESRTRALLRRLGFADPVIQLELITAEGVYRADFAWVELKIIIEFDGEGKYMDYEPTASVLLAERRRETLLMEQGWTFVRLRWSDLEKPEEVRRRIESALARAVRRSA
ncbi:type IV toxin-antitoxin system AbiEi family antitoxin domain-containing protein [Sinomonas sp. P10A9]|uniref:Type IV toxin-antitoxin system AbiEi family antitoxin domain-containing protein n=1 Tax=Sinomonas puerhi TaxID=3238584 RepID=A0AB39L1N7_9MICC